jgi:hypothetical protein
MAQCGCVLLGGPTTDRARRRQLSRIDVDDGRIGRTKLLTVRIGFGIDFFCQREAVASRLGQADQFFEPGGSGSFQVDACVETLEVRMDRGIDGELVAARVHAELEVRGKAEVSDGISNRRDIQREFLLELRNVANVIHALVEATTELGSNGLDGDSFIRDCRENDQQLHRRLCGIRLVHRDFRNEIALSFCLGDGAIDLAGLLDCCEKFMGCLLQRVLRNFELIVNAFELHTSQQFRMPLYKAIDVGVCGGLTNEIGDIDGVEVAGRKEAADGLQCDMVGVAKIGMLPIERFDCCVRSLPNRSWFRTDNSVFAIRFIPNRNHGGSTRESFDAGLQLRLGLMRKPVACPDRVFAQLAILLFHIYSRWVAAGS